MDIDTILFFELISTLMLIGIGIFYGILKGIEIRWYLKKRLFLRKMMAKDQEYYLRTFEDIKQEVDANPLYYYYQNWIKN